MPKVRITMSVDDAHLESIESVAEKAEKAGLEIEETMSFLGIITGAIESEKIGSLRKMRGVSSVEADQSIEISPPESDVQ